MVDVLAESGKKVMLVGCDPKADITRLILGAECRKYPVMPEPVGSD